jgi:hypothetical protein
VKLPRFPLAIVLGLALAVPAALSFAEPPKAGHAPDPPSVSSKKHWVIDIQVRQGKPSFTAVRSVDLSKPEPTARVMGRFAVEFWIGKELIDRVRFDVPLLEDPTKRKNRRLGSPEFAVNTRLSVRLADNARATSVVLVDRATGDTQAYAWPPGSDGKLVPLSKPAVVATDAGSDASPDVVVTAADASVGDAG